MGKYTYGEWPTNESIEIEKDGRFRYQFFSDEGGIVCDVIGNWRLIDSKTFETKIVQVLSAGRPYANCSMFPETQVWKIYGAKFYRKNSGPIQKSRWRRLTSHCSRRLRASSVARFAIR